MEQTASDLGRYHWQDPDTVRLDTVAVRYQMVAAGEHRLLFYCDAAAEGERVALACC